MKKMNKKGFTIVELVIVIAVIAILAAVMIPTFSNVVEKAQASAALQEARNLYTAAYADDLSDGVVNGSVGDATVDTAKYPGYSVSSVAGGYEAKYIHTYNNGADSVEFPGQDD